MLSILVLATMSCGGDDFKAASGGTSGAGANAGAGGGDSGAGSGGLAGDSGLGGSGGGVTDAGSDSDTVKGRWPG